MWRSHEAIVAVMEIFAMTGYEAETDRGNGVHEANGRCRFLAIGQLLLHRVWTEPGPGP
jgi:hypothetical protein